MLLKYFYDRVLSQASYLIGSEATGEAIVFDPARDISPYLAAAQQENLRIVQVVETHIHADFVSGARELAAQGAQLYLSGEGGSEWQYAYADDTTRLLYDGDTWTLGDIRIDVMHTPGHTPEHLVFAITDLAHADRPLGLITGDCLFVGDVGRPDLLEAAGGAADSKITGARDQFYSLQRLRALPDHLQVWPGHGAGSACGKALGAIPTSTLGYEKLFNPAFQFSDETSFSQWLLSDQPETPRYFAHMKRVNRDGATLLATLPPVEVLEGFILPEVLKDGALVIDVRPAEAFASAHTPGTISIPPSEKFNTYVGWLVNYDAPTYLIADAAIIPDLVQQLRAIGVDNLPGYFPPLQVASGGTEILPQVTPEEVAPILEIGNTLILDVRAASEYEAERILNAYHVHYGELQSHLDELPRDRDILVQCSSGQRSQIAASLLQRAGFSRIANLRGGLDAWKAAGLPVER